MKHSPVLTYNSSYAMAGHSAPQMLYELNDVKAYHVQDGKEQDLNPGGGQNMALWMMPTSSPFADLSSADPSSHTPEEDFFLHLVLPPEIDLPLPATTQIFRRGKNDYMIQRWDLGHESGAFTRLSLPKSATQDEIDTLETILAQCTAFMEHSPMPEKHDEKLPDYTQSAAPPAYDPAKYGASVGPMVDVKSIGMGARGDGRIVIVDEENGSVVGELDQGFSLQGSADLKSGSKSPVEIELPTDPNSNSIIVRPASPRYLEDLHPVYKKSKLVSRAAAASSLIVAASGSINNMMATGADNFTKKVQPSAKPLQFGPTAQGRIRKVHSLAAGASGLSNSTVGQVSKVAQNFGATLTRRGPRKPGKNEMGVDRDGNKVPFNEGYKPGLLNKTMMAFSTIADGIDQAGRDLLTGGSAAATTMVQHKYGQEAGAAAAGISGSIKHVGLVYIDAAGVSRRAIVKSVAKGMVVGKMRSGEDLIVGGDDSGVLPTSPQSASIFGGTGNEKSSTGSGAGDRFASGPDGGIGAGFYGKKSAYQDTAPVESFGTMAGQGGAKPGSGLGESMATGGDVAGTKMQEPYKD